MIGPRSGPIIVRFLVVDSGIIAPEGRYYAAVYY